MKQYRGYMLIIAVALLLVIVAEVFRPRPVDWRDSFSRDEKIPFGTYILHDQLDRLFPGQRVDVVDETIYRSLVGRSMSGNNYFFINSEIELSPTDSDELLRFVRNGGTVFMAAESFSGEFTDSLGIETTSILPFLISGGTDSIRVNFSSPSLRAESDYVFASAPDAAAHYFALFDEDSSVVLGTTRGGDGTDADLMANYIRVRWGAGAFYLSTLPRAFSNIGLLSRGGPRYVATALSYLPVKPVIWDEYYKAGTALGREEIQSPLRYVMSQEPLRWAYTLLLGGTVLFVIFGARRRQRIIPVIEPPRNTTLDFVETVGRLYHQHGDFRNVADKIILYFLDYVRSRLNLATAEPDDELVQRVAERSGVSREKVAELFERIAAIQRGRGIGKEELLRLSDSVEYFYRNTQR